MTFSFKEDHISQIPALMMLEKLGYTYLSPAEVMELRGGNTSNVLLEPILRNQLRNINTVQVSSQRTTVFSEQNISAGIEALRNLPMSEGYMTTSQTAYDLLTAGKTLEQIVDGDKKSYVMQYIDWNNIEKNVFHVTEEFAVIPIRFILFVEFLITSSVCVPIEPVAPKIEMFFIFTSYV